MTLPNFLCIGAQRAGTTWLDRVLRKHPAIFLPRHRKEVHFFDQHYERGVDWYASFFPADAEAKRYVRIGEITPRYLFDAFVPPRIHARLPDCRLIAILRNPVTRLYSQWGLHVRDFGERRSFAEFARDHPEAFERGCYRRQLERYLEVFDRSALLILIHEEVVDDPGRALHELAAFLGVDAAPLVEGPIRHRVNAAYAPRFGRLRAWARRVGVEVRHLGGDRLVELAKELGLPEAWGRRALPPLSAADREWLSRRYGSEVDELESFLGRPLVPWRRQENKRPGAG